MKNRLRRCPACSAVFPDDVVFCGHDGTITLEVQDPASADQRIGQRLGAYLIVAHIADGAMGRVYEGRHHESKARVAVKVLHDDVARDSVAVERFKREADTAREVAHPHVVHVIDFGRTPDGSHFMTMEYLQGEELSQLLRREGAQRADRVVRIMSQAALALNHAHSFGVIHRDLKPDNIFLCESPEGDDARILDFGSVKLQMETGPKLTAFGTTLGTPYYMSPEQAMGKSDVDQRSDVYALGAILYEMLTGQVAFDAPNVAQILMKILNSTPPAPSSVNPRVPPALDDVVEKALRRDKTRRYESTVELAEAACAAFGLAGKAQEWARTPRAVIAERAASSTPPPARPYGTPSVPPPKGLPSVAAAALPVAPGDMDADEWRPARGGKGVAIAVGLAFMAVLLIGGAAAAYWLL